MAQYQYTKEDLKDQFGWTFQQIKTRLGYLDVLLSGHYQGAKGVKYRFDERALSIFRRLYELEKEGQDLKEASKQIISEVQRPEEESTSGSVKVDQANSKYVELLEQRVEELKEDKTRLQAKVDNLENRLLPPEEEKEEDNFKDLSLVQLVKKWLTTKT